ncbi:MAG: hypothetical protein JWO03_3824 [Bacteroidetes bacterium]|nr:hypothetical protein [Bacteroidota bacterium]
MKKSLAYLLTSLVAVMVFCSFTPTGQKDYKLNFSANVTKVSSPDSLYHLPNKNPFIMVHTKLSNPNDYWVLYIRWMCDAPGTFEADTAALHRTMVLACDKNVPHIRALAPHSDIEEELIFTSDKTLKELKGMKFKLAYHMEAFDTKPASFKREEISKLPMPDLTVTSQNKTTYWSEVLEVK